MYLRNVKLIVVVIFTVDFGWPVCLVLIRVHLVCRCAVAVRHGAEVVTLSLELRQVEFLFSRGDRRIHPI